MKQTLRRRLAWLCTSLLLALAGCGPGVGGTGTGDQSSPLEFFGARPASVCASTFASQLKCATRVVIGPSQLDPSEGSAQVTWVDDPSAARVSATVEGSDIRLDANCEGAHFVGTWGIGGDDRQGRFYGEFSVSDVGGSVPATMMVQADNGVSSVFVVRDANGRVLYGPKELTRVNGAPWFQVCP